LRRALGLALLVTGVGFLKRVFLPRRLAPSEVESFATFLETLIPDGEFPGARRTLQVADLVRELEATRQKRRALVEGVALLDRHAEEWGSPSFAVLSHHRRAEVVAGFAAEEEGSVPRFFYRVVRDRAMELHYSRSLAWKALGLPHPPQPTGYRHYWKQIDE